MIFSSHQGDYNTSTFDCVLCNKVFLYVVGAKRGFGSLTYRQLTDGIGDAS